MKKRITLRFLLIIMFVFLCSGCDFYVSNYKSILTNAKDTEKSSETDYSSKTNIVNEIENYNGAIKYATSTPTTFTNWNVIYDQVKDTVVTVKNIVNNSSMSTGSGVIFSEDTNHAYIYTNAHVVENSSSLEILLANNVLVKGTLIGYDTNEDVAVIQINKRSDYNVATLRKTETLSIGEAVLSVGSPLGVKFSGTATSGIISNLNIAMTEENSQVDLYLIQIDAALNSGNSGGPLFDNLGNLIGINTMKLINSGSTTNIESFNYSIPISHFSLVANHIIQGSIYYRPFLNITVTDIRTIDFTTREQKGITVDNGLLIVTINENSILKDKANVNQVITKINNKKVTKTNDFSAELLNHLIGETITLTICDADGSNTKNINITLKNTAN